MASNKERGRQVCEQFEDALFRVAIHELVQQEGRELQSTKQILQSMPKSQPSEAALLRFTRLLDSHLSGQQAAARKLKVKQVLSRVAVAVLAILVVFGTAMTTVQAFRARIMNFWLEIQPEFTIFRLKESEPNTGNGDLIVDWVNAYVPTYIPEGYKIGSISIRESGREIIFEHSTAPIVYMELGQSSSPMIDTENADHVQTVDVNGHAGTLVQKEGVTTVVWEMGGRLFVIQSWADSNTAVKVACGVRFVK